MLFLGPAENYRRVQKAFKGDFVACLDSPIIKSGIQFVNRHDWVASLDQFDWVASFGFRYKVPKWFLDKLPHRCINIHISLLPWNKGAYPNVWAHLENTPHGITIHEMDEGLDTGPCLVQTIVHPDVGPATTFRDTWSCLMDVATDTFCKSWRDVKAGVYPPLQQKPGGSSHVRCELGSVADCLPQLWDTPIRQAKKAYEAADADAGFFDEIPFET